MAALKRLVPLVLGASFALSALPASALSLMQAYEAALKNDPAYRAAFYTSEAGKENLALGRSVLLPTVNAAWSGSRNNTSREFQAKELEPERYLSRSATVQVRQTLFSLEAFARYKQGKAQAEYASAILDSQTQELIIRVSGAYMDVLLRQTQVELARVERDAYLEQRNTNERLFKGGEGTRTDVLETQSRLDLAEAQLLEAKDSLTTAKDTLAGIIGMEVDSLSQLRSDFRASPSDMKTFEDWKRIAIDSNPDLRALQKAVEVQNQEINKQRAGHTPRLEAIGTYGKTGSETITLVDQKQTVRSIGLQLNVPIFNGGAVSAATRQAVANREKARADYEVQLDKITVELRRNYSLLSSSVARIDALMKAVDSAKLLIKATEQSIKGGVRINLDLLNAQRQLSTAQRDLAQARFNYLVGVMRLHAAAGTLSAEDVRLTAAFFE